MKRKISKKKIQAVTAITGVVLTIFIISTVPSIIADQEGPQPTDNPVYDGTVKVWLNATDDYSGVNATYYAVNPDVWNDPPGYDEIDWTVYEGPFEVTTTGENIVYFYSDDNVGNKEEIKTVSFIIYQDITPPVTTAELQGKQIDI